VEIKLDRTKRVLAAEMGTTSETLSRTLAKFRDQRFLRVKGKTVGDEAARAQKTSAAKFGRVVILTDVTLHSAQDTHSV
jgi:hypothetical protein